MTTTLDKFKIYVGDTDRTTKAQFGYPEPGMASLKAGTAIDERELSPFGDQIFPNYVELWGRRVVNGKVPQGRNEVSVTDPDYKGEIEFMPYGAVGGQTVFCRYVKGQSSLDYQYQITRLGLPKKEDDEQNLWLQLPNGEHEVDPNMDKAFAMLIKNHPFNRDSKSKNPQVSTFVYFEVQRFKSSEKANIDELDKNWEARSLVKGAKTIEELQLLHHIWSKAFEIEYEKGDEFALYEALMIFANEHSADALELVEAYKLECVDIIERAKSFEVFDVTKEGELKAGKTTLLSGIPAKGVDMIQYLMDHCMTPEGKKAIDKLHELASQNFK